MDIMLPHMQFMWLDGALPMDILLPHLQVMWLDGDCNCSTQLQKMICHGKNEPKLFLDTHCFTQK